MFEQLVLIRGGGDLGTGVAARLYRSGFRVGVLESDSPVAVRRTVSLSEAVYEGSTWVEDVQGILASRSEILAWDWSRNSLPVVVDAEAHLIAELHPFAVVDAIMAKRNTGTARAMAPCVVGLGPGFVAGDDVTAVVETNRGPDLGRVIRTGSAAPNTGVPGTVRGRGPERVLRAPAGGIFHVIHDIGAIVEEGQEIAVVGEVAVRAAFTAVVRGVVRDGLQVEAGMKIGDIDPRLDPGLCYRISDKALAVAGGVLEAVLTSINGRQM